MATTYKVLGQVNPAATTATTLYPCPASTQTVISTISVCNQAGTSATYRIAVRPNGATLAPEHYVVYDATVQANTTAAYTLGITIDASDIVTVYASSTSLSFNAFGSEIA
ncbi:hypothetical protein UFOVP655_92 [uncultured Caudovirales phage]|uniref:Uncharacterized protein n=1 Tax=uncultured Caudovirales phage TaxID=2100421 RepID=A0A6J5NCU7_9CAUD|nr:hypothetical protein UFOVP655_92 [uncultured Caudovirales phage]